MIIRDLAELMNDIEFQIVIFSQSSDTKLNDIAVKLSRMADAEATTYNMEQMYDFVQDNKRFE